MNILLLTFQGDVAGSTYSISYLAKGLAAKGHNIYVGCRKESLLFRLLQNTGVILLPMTFSGRLDLTNMRQIKHAVQQYDIRIINAQSSYDRYTSVLARWLFRLNAKVVHTRRQVSKSMGGLIQNLIYIKGTDKIVAVSEGVKVSLAQGNIPADHITVILNGTPREKYAKTDASSADALRKKFKIEKDEFVIGCVSRLKAQNQILEALTLLDFPVKIIFVGIEKQPEWEEIIRSYTVDHEIIFAGLVPSDEILNYYPLFDVKILASAMEGLSQSLLEAMALGVPVIATNASGNPELISDGENGFLFDDGKTEQLARAVKMLYKSRSLREKFIANGKKTALETFNIDNTVAGYEQLFKQLIER